MKARKWTKRQSFVLVAILVILGSLYILKYHYQIDLDTNNFVYGSKTIRIAPMNLSAIRENANSAGFKVTEGHPGGDSGYLFSPSFLGKGRFIIDYQSDANITTYHFEYGENGYEVLDEFWVKLGHYLNLSQAQVMIEKEYFNQTREELGPVVGKAVEARPLWDRIMQNQGTLVSMSTKDIGQIIYKYESGSEIEINSEFIIIRDRFIENGANARLSFYIDGDSDIELHIQCNKSLDNPLDLFSNLFEVIGLPQSVQERIQLNILGTC